MDLFDQALLRPSRALEYDDRKFIVIVFPYTGDYLTRVHQIPGCWYNPAVSGDRHWRTPLTIDSFRKVVAMFPDFKVSTLLVKHFNITPKESPPPAPVDGPQPEWISIELFPFQRAGVATLLQSDQALLADDMGLGKTFQSIAWATRPTGQGVQNNAFEGAQNVLQGGICAVCGKPLLAPKTPKYKISVSCANKIHRRLGKHTTHPRGILVVSPATVKYNWEQAIHRARPKDTVVVVDSTMSIPKAGSINWVVINYDILDKHLEALHRFNPNTIILDESHYIKNQKAIRTQTATALCLTTPRRLLVTGTPILNRPVELWPQLIALGKVQDHQFFQWAKRYCDAKKKRVSWHREVWDFGGASNLTELWHTLQPFTVRRLKKEVLPDLPEILYTEALVPLSIEYAKAYADEVVAYEEWIAEREKGKLFSSTGEHLAHLVKLRQLVVAGKVQGLLERLGDFVETNTKAVIFCTYLQAGLFQLRNRLPKTYKYISITGEQSPKEREQLRQNFQNDPTVLFALCSTMAANMGIDLFAASTVIFLDNPWVPGWREQAIARTHRIGQTADKVHVIDLIGKDTIDESVLKILRRKQHVINEAVDGIAPPSPLTEGDIALFLAKDFAARRVHKRR